jgi:hypothetical protein
MINTVNLNNHSKKGCKHWGLKLRRQSVVKRKMNDTNCYKRNTWRVKSRSRSMSRHYIKQLMRWSLWRGPLINVHRSWLAKRTGMRNWPQWIHNYNLNLEVSSNSSSNKLLLLNQIGVVASHMTRFLVLRISYTDWLRW